MKKVYETITHPLEPIFDKNSKILILGSFPSVKTREVGFYYGNKYNRFWKVLENLYGEKITETKEAKIDFLLKEKIALWDVIYKCDIVGSSDSSIKNVIPSDLEFILENSKIEKIFCNGNKSFELYKKYQEERTKIKAEKLPSTSPANARYSIEKLSENWKIIKAATFDS